MLEIGRAICERLMRSEKPLPLSRIQEEMGTHFDTLKHHLKYIQLAQSMPKVTVTKVGKQVIVETEKSKEDLEFLKEIVGEELPDHVYLLVDLHDAGATTFEGAVPLSVLNACTPNAFNILDEQAAQERVIVTTGGRAYLTPLGIGIAKGAKRYISLAEVRRKIPQTTSFEIPTSLPKKPSFTVGTKAEPGFPIPASKVKVRREGGDLIYEIRIKSFEMIQTEEEQP